MHVLGYEICDLNKTRCFETLMAIGFHNPYLIYSFAKSEY